MLHTCILAMLIIVSYAGEYGHPYYEYATEEQEGNEEQVEGEEIPAPEF